MKKTLRPHQEAAVKAAFSSLKEGNRPYLDCCVGFGKSLVLAHITNVGINNGRRVLQLVPSKELCEQNYTEAFEYVDKQDALGIVCAGLNKNQVRKQALVATYTTFLNRMEHCGKFDLLMIDECDMISPSPSSSYQKIIRYLLRVNPDMKMLGVTGTPYRLDQGFIENDCIKGKATFNVCAYQSNISEMIAQGYLSKVTSLTSEIHPDIDSIKISNGEFNTKDMGVKFESIVDNAVTDAKEKFKLYDIETSVIFTSTVQNAQHVIDAWGEDNIRLLTGETAKPEREKIIGWLKNGTGKRYVVNVGILTVGFNFPALDAIVLLRATTSTRLYVQMVGRVLRPAEDKHMAYVLDYGTNIDRLGPVDNIATPRTPRRRGEAPKRICTECGEVNTLKAKYCKKCKAMFIVSDDGNYSMRTQEQILKQKMLDSLRIIDIDYLFFVKAYSTKDGTPMIKMIIYNTDGIVAHSHYLMPEHSGFAKTKTIKFIRTLLKNKNDYIELTKEGEFSVDTLLILLEKHYDTYFHKIQKIMLLPQKNSKYMDLKAICIDGEFVKV